MAELDLLHLPVTVVANDTARLALTGFTAADVGRLYRQTDTSEYWVLTASTPTWERLGLGRAVVGIGHLQLSVPALTDLELDVWTRIAGTFAAGGLLWGFSAGASGAALQYDGARTASVHAVASGTLVPASAANTFGLRFAIDGVPVGQSARLTPGSTGDAPLWLSEGVTLSTGEELELLLANHTDTTDATVSQLSLMLIAIA